MTAPSLATATALSRYGLPKRRVFTERPTDLPPRSEPWLAARDDFDGLLLDALAAYEAGLISRKAFTLDKTRLTIARRRADTRLREAIASAVKSRSNASRSLP